MFVSSSGPGVGYVLQSISNITIAGNSQLLANFYVTGSKPRCGSARGMYRPAKSTWRRPWYRPLSMLR